MTQVNVPVLGGYIVKRGNHSRIDTAVVLGHVGNLCPFTPDNLAGGGDETQLGDVDLDNGTLRQNTQLGEEGVVGVLLDGEDGQLNSHTEFGARSKENIR